MYAGVVGEGGGALGAHATPPPPHLEKKLCSEIFKRGEEKFFPDMSAKKNMHIPLRYDKIKTKNNREKIRCINKRDKIKEIKKNDSC